MQLIHPTLLLDEDKCRQNILRMVDIAKKHQLTLKPHFKTHQSDVIGEWFKQAGVTSIEVSSLAMAKYFADAGWKDITWGFPVNIRAIEEINSLASRVTLSLFVNNVDTARFLGKNLQYPVQVYTEIDTGSQRTGISSDDVEKIKQLLTEFKEYDLLKFKGFYTHDGHTYATRNVAEIKKIHQTSVGKMLKLKSELEPEFGPIMICKGDTPACSVAEDSWEGIDEISAGNFVFYDFMQCEIGSCELDEVAVCMACPVVELHPERGEVFIHGGAVHFSKDNIVVDGVPSFGQVVLLDGLKWGNAVEGASLSSISQEHGVIKAPVEWINQLNVGDLVGIVPIHSCLTANLMSEYLTTESEQIHQF